MDSQKYAQGIALFNAGEFFDAHEALEDVWRESSGPEKPFLQGLIQIAVALHHYSTGNLVGARSLLARGARQLNHYPDAYGRIDLGKLRAALGQWEAALSKGTPPPKPPQIEPASPDARINPPVQNPSEGVVAVESAAQVRQVPLLDLRRQYQTIREEVLAAVERVCATQHFILGEEVATFEREVAAYVGTADAVGCASGSDALWLALMAGGIGPGDAVITTPFSFLASASAIVRAGARPVFVDVDPGTLNIDPEAVDRRVARSAGARLRAILPVHLFGQCADMESLQRIAGEHRLMIIEDAAQAFGASWRGQRAGSFGTAAAFSFYPTKNLSAYGEAGCLTTNDAALADYARRLRNHGSRERYYHDEIGWNCRLDALQAAILRVKMRYIEQWNEARRQRDAIYDRLFTSAGLVSDSDSSAPVRRLKTHPDAFHIFHQYVVRVSRRDVLRQFLTARGVGTEIYYPVPLHLQKCLRNLGYVEGDLPEAERAACEVLALPMFPEITEDEQKHVVEQVAEFYS